MDAIELNRLITDMGLLEDVNKLIWDKLVELGIRQYEYSTIMNMTKTHMLTKPLGMIDQIRNFVIDRLPTKLPDPSQLTGVLPPPPMFAGPSLQGRSGSTSIVSPIPLQTSEAPGSFQITSGGIRSPPPPIARPGDVSRLMPAPMATGLPFSREPAAISQTGIVPIIPTVVSTDDPMKNVVPISVTITRSKMQDGTVGVIAKGDDTYANIRTEEFGIEMIRLSCIYGNSSVFHALAKCLLPEYAHNRNYNTRVGLANNLRAQIGYFWTSDSRYYLASGGGQWAKNAKISVDQINNALVTSATATPVVDIDEYGKRINYSPEGVMNLFNSDRIVDHKFYGDIANALGIKIILVSVIGNLSADTIRFKHEYPDKVEQNFSSGRVVILFQPDSNITEIVGIKTPKGQLQIVFNQTDRLVNTIRAKI